MLKGIAHITGGGFIGNIPRVLPQGVAAHLHKDTWDIQPIFKMIQEKGDMEEAEMYRVFNMGIGMTIVCSPHQVAKIVSVLPQAKAIGEIIKRQNEERVIVQ
jgi:phosphoribosylformylglycinamidine cyclo-ligase